MSVFRFSKIDINNISSASVLSEHDIYRSVSQLLLEVISAISAKRNIINFGVKQRLGKKKYRFQPISRRILETVRDRAEVAIDHKSFQVAQKSSTLDDLEGSVCMHSDIT